tara:strand:- start:80 stop:241 length:162 start_codon:yes stop_codon:yes gene_type:complete
MKDAKQTEQTPAESLLFQLQFMGLMMMSGRQDDADAAYQKAQKLAQQLVDAGY